MKMLLALFAFVSLYSVAAQAKDIDFKSCSVVEVGIAGNHILEEGLGSIYDLDWDGYANADSDSTTGSIRIQGDKIDLDLGQGGWDSEKYKIDAKPFTYDSEITGKDTEGVELTITDGGDVLRWRIFPDYKIAIVNYTGNKYKNAHLATLDCSGPKDIRSRK